QRPGPSPALTSLPLTLVGRALDRIDEPVQVDGGVEIGWLRLAAADRLGEVPIHLADIVGSPGRRARRHVHESGGDGDVAQLVALLGALQAHAAELRRILSDGDERALAPVDLHTVAARCPR